MQKSSADAMELESEDKRSILGDIAGEAQSFEIKLAGLVMAYRSKSMLKADPDIRVKYQKDYDLRGFVDEVNEFLAFRNIGLSPEVDLKARQDLVRKHYAEEMPPDELDALVKTMTLKTAEPATAGLAIAPGASGAPAAEPPGGAARFGQKPAVAKEPDAAKGAA